MNKVLLALSITILSGSLVAQESPVTPRTVRVQISEGPEVPFVGGYLTVIRWTVNNPGGLPVHKIDVKLSTFCERGHARNSPDRARSCETYALHPGFGSGTTCVVIPHSMCEQFALAKKTIGPVVPLFSVACAGRGHAAALK